MLWKLGKDTNNIASNSFWETSVIYTMQFMPLANQVRYTHQQESISVLIK